MSARVLIVDDDVDSCWLVALVLRRDPNLALAGEATDGEMAVSLVRQERPDVVVMVMTLKPREAPQIRELAVRQGFEGRPARPSSCSRSTSWSGTSWSLCPSRGPRVYFGLRARDTVGHSDTFARGVAGAERTQ